MLNDLKKRTHPKLSEQDISTLIPLGQIFEAEDKEIVQKEGPGPRSILVVLEGRLRAFRHIAGSEELLAILYKDEFTGDLTLLTGEPAYYYIQSCGRSKLLRLGPEVLRKLIGEESSLGDMFLAALSRRVRQIDTTLVQEEKLAALGKMCAGLAHELNNPAAAARRAATLMLEAVMQAPVRVVNADKNYTSAERENLIRFTEHVIKRPQTPPLDPIEHSDREQEILDWLESRQIPRSDEIAPLLTDACITPAQLDEWTANMGANIGKTMIWLETVIRLNSLARDIETSTNRVSELVIALKDYSYMDQARFQEVDIHRGLENTLKIMSHKLKKGVVVKRDYAQDVPKICAYPGELNQVWTNLIDNAVDAMDGVGTLTIRTRALEHKVSVEVIDTGKGIPPEVQSKIFEPFFTTKSQGKGTGLGLDISYRVVVYRHGGCIRVRSIPGNTVFEVLLPVNPPRESDIVATLDEKESVPSL